MIKKENLSLLKSPFSPFVQAGVVLVLMLLFLITHKAFGGADRDPLTAWWISGSFVLFFAFFNAIIGLATKAKGKYQIFSIPAFLGVVLLAAVLAELFSGVSILDAGSYRWIFIVIGIVYLVFLAITNLMRTIIEIAIDQDKKLRNEE